MKTIFVILLTVVIICALVNVKQIHITTDDDKDNEIAYWRELFYQMKKENELLRDKYNDHNKNLNDTL